MILIDKNKPVQHIILTLTESTNIENAKYLMVLKNDANRDVFKFFLPANSSDAITRYDLFTVSTDVFKMMGIGYYTFNIYQQISSDNIDIESQLGEAIEVGKTYIIDTKNVPAQDQYIVYDLEK